MTVSIRTINRGRTTLRASTRGGSIVDITREKDGQWVPVVKTTALPFTDFFHGTWWMVPYTARMGRPGAPGVLTWRGRTYNLGSGAYKDKDWAIHGPLCREDLDVQTMGDNMLMYRFEAEKHQQVFPDLYPWPFDAEVRYIVQDTTAMMSFGLTNRSEEEAPFGWGLHTFFPHAPVKGAHAELRMKAAGYYRKRRVQGSGRQYIALPEGQNEEIPSAHRYDDWRRVQLGHDDGYVNVEFPIGIRWKKAGIGLEIRSTEAQHATLFTPEDHPIFRPKSLLVNDGGYFALEPLQTLANWAALEEDGVNSGIVVLQPGQSLTGVVELVFSDI